MRRTTWWALLACGALVGCGEPANDGINVPDAPTRGGAIPGGPERIPGAAPAPGVEKAPGEEKTPGEARASVLTPDEIANLKKLPEADAKLALEQQVCPVSDEHLGSEGMEPIKVAFEGKTVLLCCDSCKEAFEKEPAKFVAKLSAPK